MKAAIFEEVGQPFRIGTVADPRPLPDEVLLEVAYCGICGSDLHMTEHQGILPRGAIIGHEFAGTIVDIGPDVRGKWKVGDRVTALPIFACHDCDMCDQHLYSMCSSMYLNGVGKRDGAYAQYVATRGRMLQLLPSGVDFREGAMTEPLAVAFHTVDLAELRPGENVLVMGGGPIGLGVALFAKIAGARHVIVSEPAAGRSQLAREVGATNVINPKTENVAARFTEIAGSAPDVVFECVGIAGLLDQAMTIVRTRGRVIVAGVMMGDDAIKPLTGISKELSVRFTQCYTPRDYEVVIDLVAQGRAKPRPMVTEIIGLDALPEKFEALRRPSTQCKILIDPSA